MHARAATARPGGLWVRQIDAPSPASASLQTWKYVEGVHSALQEEFGFKCRSSNPDMNLTVYQLKLLSNPTYADVHAALKRQLHGDKGEV